MPHIPMQLCDGLQTSTCTHVCSTHSNIPIDGQLPNGELTLKAGCLSNDFGKQPTIPLMNLGRKLTLK